MTKSKKIFLGVAGSFLILLLYASYDIATRTTFPGSRPQLKDRIEKRFITTDSSKNSPGDTVPK